MITNFFSPCCLMTIQCQYSSPQKHSLHLHWLELCRLLQLTKNSVFAHLSLRENSPLLFDTLWLTWPLAGGGGLNLMMPCWDSGNPAWFWIIDAASPSLSGYKPSLSDLVSLSMMTMCLTGGGDIEEIAGWNIQRALCFGGCRDFLLDWTDDFYPCHLHPCKYSRSGCIFCPQSRCHPLEPVHGKQGYGQAHVIQPSPGTRTVFDPYTGPVHHARSDLKWLNVNHLYRGT